MTLNDKIRGFMDF